jgi:hypothetical protein
MNIKLEKFKGKLPNAQTPRTLVLPHYSIAYVGLAVSGAISIATFSLIPGILFLPISLFSALGIIATYQLARIAPDGSYQVGNFQITPNLIGWLQDTSNMQPKLRHGLQFPRAFYDVTFRTEEFDRKGQWLEDQRYNDTGFLSLATGFQVFAQGTHCLCTLDCIGALISPWRVHCV